MTTRDASKVYQVTLINEVKGLKKTVRVRGNEYIVDAAEQQNVELPYACRAGACITCTGKLIEGQVDQNDHCFLREKELKAGFVLLCAAYPMSDCTIATHEEEALFDLY
jgi:ferredoxin